MRPADCAGMASSWRLSAHVFFVLVFARAARASQLASDWSFVAPPRPANFVEGLRLGAGRARVGRARRRVGAYRTSVRYPEPPGKTPAHPTRAQTRFPARHALCDLFVPIYRIRHHGCEARGPGPRGQERREGAPCSSPAVKSTRANGSITRSPVSTHPSSPRPAPPRLSRPPPSPF